MKQDQQKRQVRRCGRCHRVGHNTATCIRLTTAAASMKSVSPPLKFFVHHVSSAPAESPHVMDLKQRANPIWHKVEAVAPDDTPLTLYHSYHLQSDSNSKTADTSIQQPLIPSGARQTIIPGWREPEESTAKPVVKRWPSPAIELKLREPLFKFIFNSLGATIRMALVWLQQKRRQVLPWPRLAVIAITLAVVILAPGMVRAYYYKLESTRQLVTSQGMAGFAALQDSARALKQADLGGAEQATGQAMARFNEALGALQSNQTIQTIVATVPVFGKDFRNREELLLAGQEIAVGNGYIFGGFRNQVFNAQDSFLKRAQVITAYIQAALPNYRQAIKHLNTIDSAALPLEYQEKFTEFRRFFAGIVSDFTALSDVSRSFEEIFGGAGRRRYLVIFQNTAELRPTGGFVGSFAVLEVKDGHLISLDIPPGGSYDLQGQLDTYVEPPQPLLLVAKRWEFQDANWFPDFSTSAQKMLWFYQHSRGVTADGVIAINAQVLERLLSVTGSIYNAKRNLTLTADNALSQLQTIVEYGPEKKDHKPKQILSDLTTQLLDYFQNGAVHDIVPLFSNLREALEQKEIQVYFTDVAAQDTARTFGWTGQVLSTGVGQDYIFVVNTNIHGEKSDLAIHQTITHQAVVAEDGSVTHTVVITLAHIGARGEKLYGQTNIDYIRVYVPEGSELISAGGFTWPDEKSFRSPESWYTKDAYLTEWEQEVKVDERSGTRVTKEFGKTAFGNWVVTEPGATSQAQFSYRLPFKITVEQPSNGLGNTWRKALSVWNMPLASFQLVVQKQSGIESGFESELIFPSGWHPRWTEGDYMKTAKNGVAISLPILEKDTLWSLLIEKDIAN